MKRMTQISTLMGLMLLFMISSGSAQELKKGYQESYDVNANARIDIQNKYGQVHVNTWNKNQVQVDVEVRVDAKSEKESREALDKINVKLSGSNDLVKVVTVIDGKFNCKNCNIDIDIEINAPSSNTLILKNEFGNAYIQSREGANDIRVEYGNLEAQDLNGNNNQIVVKFGDARINSAKAVNLNMEYSALELGKAGELDLFSRFNSLEIGEVSEMVLDSQYDGIVLGSGNVVKAKASFTDLQIDEVFDVLELVSAYGGVEVSRVAGGFSLVDVTSEFGGVEIGLSSSASYSLSASSSFGEIDYPEGRAEVKKEIEKNFEKVVEAFVGDDKSSKSVVKVSVKNADLEIN